MLNIYRTYDASAVVIYGLPMVPFAARFEGGPHFREVDGSGSRKEMHATVKICFPGVSRTKQAAIPNWGNVLQTYADILVSLKGEGKGERDLE